MEERTIFSEQFRLATKRAADKTDHAPQRRKMAKVRISNESVNIYEAAG